MKNVRNEVLYELGHLIVLIGLGTIHPGLGMAWFGLRLIGWPRITVTMRLSDENQQPEE